MPTKNVTGAKLYPCPIKRDHECPSFCGECKIYQDKMKNENFKSKCSVTKKCKGDHVIHRPYIEVCSKCFTVVTNFKEIELKLCDEQLIEQLKMKSKSELKSIIKEVSNV